jgi:hypothetical protein
MGRGALWTAQFYAYAAWECITANDVEAERYYRLKTATTILAGVDNWGEIDEQYLATIVFKAAEMLRRAGKVDEAKIQFNRVSEFPPSLDNEFLPSLVRLQLTHPRDIRPSLGELQSLVK